jgi:3-keto-disaccharide hydrolase
VWNWEKKIVIPVQILIKGSYFYTLRIIRFSIGDWSRWEITALGNHISLSIKGIRVVDFVDGKMSNKLAGGSIGLYTEDAKVEFGNIDITPYDTK